MLSVKKIHKSFGGLKALNGVSIEVEDHSITGLVGPNGSGKTTLFNIISGLYTKDGGEIVFKGEKIDRLSPSERAKKGLCRTFQVSKAPAKMTVLENMLLAGKNQVGEGMTGALFKWRQTSGIEKVNLKRAMELLELVRLKDLGNEYAGNLSGGQKKLLALARTLMADPQLVLLDEPTAGVNPTLTLELLEFIRDLKKKGTTFLIIEHNMKVINAVCERVYVLDIGEKIAEGSPEEIQRNERVLKAYLSGKAWNEAEQTEPGS
jgi:ABC-type branched-subunit amino acid transport system ATPase component